MTAGRPTAAPRWWRAQGALGAERLVLEALREDDAPAPCEGPCGLAAPCSLPRPFLVHLGLAGDRAALLQGLEARTAARLMKEARAYASRSPRGGKAPLRDPRESRSALARDRLAAFRAAVPLLRRAVDRTLPWGDGAPALFEVDVAATLAALGLPHSGLGGASREAILRRASVLDGLGTALHLTVDARPVRDLAVASKGAFDAVVACAAAAWFARARPTPPANDAEAWLPLP